MKIIFKNLEKSNLTSNAVKERLEILFKKFPSLKPNDLECTLAMENSLIQGGQDVFNVKIHVRRGTYQGVVLEKSASNLYIALANVLESIHERFRRFDEKARSIHRDTNRFNKKQIIDNQEEIRQQYY